MNIVRINKYPKDHINAYAQVVQVDSETGAVHVSNMNMPFAGTFAYEMFEYDEVKLVNGIGE